MAKLLTISQINPILRRHKYRYIANDLEIAILKAKRGDFEDSAITLRKCIEGAVNEADKASGGRIFDVEDGDKLYKRINLLKEDMLLSKQEADILHKIRITANKAAHSNDGEKVVISTDEIYSYVYQVNKITSKLCTSADVIETRRMNRQWNNRKLFDRLLTVFLSLVVLYIAVDSLGIIIPTIVCAIILLVYVLVWGR